MKGATASIRLSLRKLLAGGKEEGGECRGTARASKAAEWTEVG